MAEKKPTRKKTKATKTELKYTKAQIVNSAKYVKCKDLLCVLLDEDKSYTLEEVNNLIFKFKKGEM